jgi:hypothetical protein
MQILNEEFYYRVVNPHYVPTDFIIRQDIQNPQIPLIWDKYSSSEIFKGNNLACFWNLLWTLSIFFQNLQHLNHYFHSGVRLRQKIDNVHNKFQKQAKLLPLNISEDEYLSQIRGI